MLARIAACSLLAVAAAGCSWLATKTTEKKDGMDPTAFHALELSALDGSPLPLARFAGKPVLVVNTASECGYTGQYEGLEALHRTYAGKGLIVLGCPSNDFGGQEPGSPAEIRQFCTERFDVSFPLTEKVVTVPGPQQSPLYVYLGESTGHLPGWNFCKYLVGKDGQVLGFWPSPVEPDDPALRLAIDKALAAP